MFALNSQVHAKQFAEGMAKKKLSSSRQQLSGDSHHSLGSRGSVATGKTSLRSSLKSESMHTGGIKKKKTSFEEMGHASWHGDDNLLKTPPRASRRGKKKEGKIVSARAVVKGAVEGSTSSTFDHSESFNFGSMHSRSSHHNKRRGADHDLKSANSSFSSIASFGGDESTTASASYTANSASPSKSTDASQLPLSVSISSSMPLHVDADDDIELDMILCDTIHQSWDRVRKIAGYQELLGGSVLIAMRKKEKKTKELLGMKTADFTELCSTIVRMVDDLVTTLGPSTASFGALGQQWQRQQGLNVQVLPLFCSAVIASIKDVLKPDFSAEMEESWKCFLQCVMSRMMTTSTTAPDGPS